MEAYSDFFWTVSRQYLLHDKFGAVLGFATQSQLERVKRSIEESGCSSVEEWWDKQNAICNEALKACDGVPSQLRLPTSYLLSSYLPSLVDFRHFCKHFKEA